jgi:2-iminobutanoate/2-iminopropanoate deaminase
MVKQQISAAGAPTPKAPYSQGIRAGDFIYVSGQGPLDSMTGEVKGSTIEEQTAYTLQNVQAILEAGGASMADVVKTTCHLSDLAHFGRFNEVYAQYFPEPRPVRTTVGSQLLGILVEVDVVAYVGK